MSRPMKAPDGRFAKGNPGGPGRPKGSRNKFNPIKHALKQLAEHQRRIQLLKEMHK